MTLHNLGHALHHNGDLSRAGASFAQSLVLFREAGAKAGIGMCFAGIAGVAGAWGGTRPERAARLFGAAEVLFDTTATALQAADLADYRHNLTASRSQLDEATWKTAWELGQAMTTEQAIAYALEEVS